MYTLTSPQGEAEPVIYTPSFPPFEEEDIIWLSESLSIVDEEEKEVLGKPIGS